MKKSLIRQFAFILFLVFFFPFIKLVNSQDIPPILKKGNFNIGVEGGVQFTNINLIDSFYQPSSKLGFQVGMFGEYYFANDWKVKLGAYYDSRAFELYGERIFGDTAQTYYSNSYHVYQVDYNMNYLTIPIGIGYERGSDKFKLILHLNFYYSLLLNSNMNGSELYYFDPVDGIDLSNTILKQGYNSFLLSGETEGLSITNVSTRVEGQYLVEEFNNSDFGFNLMLGGQYQASPNTAFNLSFGFSFSTGHLFEDTSIDAKWSQITRINLGFVYTLD